MNEPGTDGFAPIEVESPSPAAPAFADTPASHGPVMALERIQVVDVLRGFALLGILFVNMQFYTTPMAALMALEPFWPATHDVVATELIQMFAVGKFYTMFSFLFGLGISIQLLRAEAKGGRFVGYHIRRMFVLLAIGLAHAFFIWMGDILVTYAVLGFVLLFFLRRQPRTLLIWAGIILALLFLLFMLGAAVFALFGLIPEAAQKINEALATATQGQQEIVANVVRIYSRGSFWEIMKLRAEEVLSAWMFIFLFQGPISFAMFLIGMYVGKRALFHDIAGNSRLFRWGCLLGLSLGLVGNAIITFMPHVDNLTMNIAAQVAGAGISVLATPALSLGYGCTLVLMFQRNWGQRLLNPLAPVGQMALTNYLAQSLICTTIFYGYGFGWYAQISPLGGIVLTVLIYAVEVLWSNLWLRVLGFRFGPMEWLWRTLTYGRLQSIR